MQGKVRTRFAPSPTGYLHIGGARTALFNYLFARNRGGEFILRIEDTDRRRSTKESTQQVFDSLRWLGLNWDEGPGVGENESLYYQSNRLEIYNRYFKQLLDTGKVYPCFCSDRELSEKKRQAQSLNIPNIYDRRCYHLTSEEVEKRMEKGLNYIYRFKVEPKEIVLDDLVKGVVKFDTQILGDFIVRKEDGFPTYNFAVVIDDIEMSITHVLRGDDHLSNTPKQLLLYEALGCSPPIFAHVSMILGADRQKLSKRHGATGLLDLKEKGYLKEPIINFLALLGWSPGISEEIFSQEKLIELFSRTKFNKAPAIFDYGKLDYLNGSYIRSMSIEKIKPYFIPHIEALFKEKKDFILNSEDRLHTLIVLIRDHCHVLSDIPKYMRDFISENITIDNECLHYLQTKKAQLLVHLAIDMWSHCTEEVLKEEEFSLLIERAKEKEIKGKSFFKPMRVALTGKEDGYELKELIKVIPRTFILERLRKSI